MIWKSFNFQLSCIGDSGGPIIWEDRKDKTFRKRAYVMGIISKGSILKGVCGSVKNNFYSTIGVTVPGKVVRWIKSFKEPEIKDCLRT